MFRQVNRNVVRHDVGKNLPSITHIPSLLHFLPHVVHCPLLLTHWWYVWRAINKRARNYTKPQLIDRLIADRYSTHVLLRPIPSVVLLRLWNSQADALKHASCHTQCFIGPCQSTRLLITYCHDADFLMKAAVAVHPPSGKHCSIRTERASTQPS